jgi:hypothetical protein
VVTAAQRRLIDTIKAFDGYAEYWPVVNDWVRDKGPAKALALRNINRTVEALERGGYVRFVDGLFELTERGKRA